jgi:adenylate cyclase
MTPETPETPQPPQTPDEEGTTPEAGPVPGSEAMWRGILLGTDPRYRRSYALFRRMPGSPRCYFCSAPFGGLGAPVARLMGRRPWPKNPKYCATCFLILEHERGGAEIDCSLLFADVRGSTALAEGMSPGAYHKLIERFYETAARVLFAHDAVLDKFVGDEVVAIFIPALNGELHAERAVATGQALLEATGHGTADGPWVPLGIGVHSGVAFVGAVGDAPSTALTALGDVVNVAARLASAAGPGELLVTEPAAVAAHLESAALEHRRVELKGKAEPVPVVVLGSRSGAGAGAASLR